LEPEDLGVRVERLDHRGVGDDLVAQFGQGVAGRVDVAVGAVPQPGLVAHRVVLRPAVLRVAERADEVLDPGTLDARAVGFVSETRVVTGDVLATGEDPVAPGRVERVDALLWAVNGGRERAEDRAARPEFRGPVEEVDGDARLGPAGLGGTDP